MVFKPSHFLNEIILEFQKNGHTVIVFPPQATGSLHDYLAEQKIVTYSFNIKKSNPIIYHFRHCRYLINFIKKHQIDLVFSHIQQPNLVASIAQYFVNSRVILCRHHSDCAYVDNNWKEKLTDWIWL